MKDNYHKEEDRIVDKKKISYLLLLLLLTGVLLSTSTYAWFTTNRVVSVDTLDVKVKSEGSLEISVDAINWKTSVNEEELKNAIDTYPASINQLPGYIRPVSTVGDITNGLINMYLGTVTSNATGDYIITSQKVEEREGNGEDFDAPFLSFDLFLKTNNTKDLYLTNESKVTYNDTTSVGTENATRVALLIEGHVDTNGNAQTLKTNDKNNLIIWEPNYDTHTASGISNARDVYNINTTETGGTLLPYDGIKDEISSTNNITLNRATATNYGGLFERVIPKITTVKDFTDYQNLFVLEAGITKIRVYLWLEGQDVDCENNASVGNLSFNLQFSTNPA